MHRRVSSKVGGGDTLRLDIPKSPSVYGTPESPQSQTAPLFAGAGAGTSTPPMMSGYASSRASSATFSAQHMRVPDVGMTGAMPAQSAFSFSSKYLLSPDPAQWHEAMLNEPDDELHRPDPRRDRKSETSDARGMMQVWMGRGRIAK